MGFIRDLGTGIGAVGFFSIIMSLTNTPLNLETGVVAVIIGFGFLIAGVLSED